MLASVSDSAPRGRGGFSMSRWMWLAAALLLAVPAAAIEVECPGSTWYGSDLRDCPCCERCPDWTWRLGGDEPCLSFSEAAEAALEAMPDSKRYRTVGPESKSSWASTLFGVGGDLVRLALAIIVAGAIFGLYFLPSFMAKSRKHHQSDAIFLTNLFLGWTFLGWVVALIWSATATDGKRA